MHAANCVFVVKLTPPWIYLQFGNLTDEALAVAAVLSPVAEKLLCQKSICQASDCTTNATWFTNPWHLCKAFTASRVPEWLVMTEYRTANQANSFRGCSPAARTNVLPPPVKTPWKRLTLFYMAHQRRLYFSVCGDSSL
ncbi:hypothetical protein TRVL_06718 [Trypanosoma vivax]|nr:hypothetical protein TRVL_06718 [Trypanosoma vivax]